jgi:hypothetical protein
MKNRVAEAKLAGLFLSQRHQLPGEAFAAVFRLHEYVEDIGAAVVGRVARMRRPVDHHHPEAGNDLSGFFQHPAKIASIAKTRDQPLPESRCHRLQTFAGAAGRGEHPFAMLTNQFKIARRNRPCGRDHRRAPSSRTAP